MTGTPDWPVTVPEHARRIDAGTARRQCAVVAPVEATGWKWFASERVAPRQNRQQNVMQNRCCALSGLVFVRSGLTLPTDETRRVI